METSVARSDEGMERCRYVCRTGSITPNATAPTRKIGTVIQNERIAPVPAMATVNSALAAIRMVVRPRPAFAVCSAMKLPATPATENSAAITPASQTAFLPYSSRKYGGHAYQAQAKKPLTRNDCSISSRVAR